MFLCLVFLVFSHVNIAASLSPAGKGLPSWLFYCIFVTFLCVILGQVWCLNVSFPDICRLSYFSASKIVQP